MKPVVKYVFSEIHMGSQHDGLNELIKTHKKKSALFAKAIKDGGLILFLNTQRTRMKLFSENGEVIGYYRSRENKKITKETIQEIPNTFGGSVEFSNAAKGAISKFLDIEQESAQAV